MVNVFRFVVNQTGWQRLRSIVAAFTVSVVIPFAITGCGGGGSTPTVQAPGEPTNFTVVATPEAILSATLTWSPPLSGGTTTSFEIYRNTTAGSTFDPANHLLSIPVVAGQTTYDFIDDVGLEPKTEYYYVVAAKNAGGETPTAEKPFVTGGGPPSGTGDTAFGNNFSAALIFADGYGISGLPITGTWTTDATAIDTNTGLRPLTTELPLPVVVLPYLDPDSAFILNNVTYYRQKTASTWQGEWMDGSSTPQDVNAAWGDNLISQSLTTNSVIRIEMVLSEALTTPMTSYTMQSLYGTRENEVAGTDGTTYDNSTAFVFAANAHLTVQKLDATGAADGTPLFDQTLWTGDGPGHLAGEVNVLGNFTYGFVWNLKDYTDAGLLGSNGITTGVAGTWRITFSLDPTVLPLAPTVVNNNTFIDTATNGVLVDDTHVYIDINVQP